MKELENWFNVRSAKIHEWGGANFLRKCKERCVANFGRLWRYKYDAVVEKCVSGI